MKYLLLLLAPVLLSSSFDRSSSVTLPLVVRNDSTCDAEVEVIARDGEGGIVMHETCDAGTVRILEISANSENAYLCSVKVGLGKSSSSEFYLDSRCGSSTTAQVENCTGTQTNLEKIINGGKVEVNIRP